MSDYPGLRSSRHRKAVRAYYDDLGTLTPLEMRNTFEYRFARIDDLKDDIESACAYAVGAIDRFIEAIERPLPSEPSTDD